MRKTDVINFFGSAARVARCFGVSEAAVSQWGEVIPETRAYQAQVLSNGILVVDPDIYRDVRRERAPAA